MGRAYYEMSIFNWYDGYLSAIYAPHYARSAQRVADVRTLSGHQMEALDVLHSLADNPRLNIVFSLESGDLLFVHNHTIMHHRTA